MLRLFGNYLIGLNTQPVTISIPGIVDYMIDTYAAACADSSPFSAFAWARSAELLRSTLEAFVSTRDCFFHHENRLPVVEATFDQALYQVTGELFVGIRFNWNPPTVAFDNLQNVYQENRALSLTPQLHDHQDVEFETELGNLLPWNPVSQQFEGRWPPILASMAGAQRLEAYTLSLDMRAQIRETFPGAIQFERTIRLAIPITIKRKPDTCSTSPVLPYSPAVMRPAGSYTITSPDKWSSTNSTPQAVMNRFASEVQDSETPPTYKEIDDLLKRKAKTGGPMSPLRLNSLSMAQL